MTIQTVFIKSCQEKYTKDFGFELALPIVGPMILRGIYNDLQSKCGSPGVHNNIPAMRKNPDNICMLTLSTVWEVPKDVYELADDKSNVRLYVIASLKIIYNSHLVFSRRIIVTRQQIIIIKKMKTACSET